MPSTRIYSVQTILLLVFVLISIAIGADNFVPNQYPLDSSSIIATKRPKDTGVLLEGNTQNLNHFFTEESQATTSGESSGPTVTGTLPHQTTSAFLLATIKNKNTRHDGKN